MTTIKRRFAAAASAAALALCCVFGASAEGINIVNDKFEEDIWADGSAWTVEADWDALGSSTVAVKDFDDGAAQPSGKSAGLNLWVQNAGTLKVNQTVEVPAGSYTVKVAAMGSGAKVSVAVGDTVGEAKELSGWATWDTASVDFTSSGSTETLSIIFDGAADGWGWVDTVDVEVVSSNDNSESQAESSSESQADTGSSESKAESSKAESSKTESASSSKAETSSKNDSSSASTAVPTTIQNGDFETYSETELAWWDVDWKDNLKIWFADAEAKNARADKNNNYLNVWAEKADHFSMKQTVHLKAGTYGVKFNLDANEGYDTGVKLKVGDLVDYTLPKGEGWEKWTQCETPAFTVKDEGDYVIEFYGDLKADAWFCLDNIALTDGKGTAVSSSSAASNNSGSSSSSSSSAADNKNAETGTGAGALMAVMAVAGAGMVVSKRKSEKR